MSKNKAVNYKASKTCGLFHNSPAFFRGIMGPIGSGKSVACIVELYRLGCLQEPDINGVRKTRHIIVRNTLPQLETTTMKSWDDWFSERDGFGRRSKKPPYTQVIRQNMADGSKMEMEIIFLALDKPEDIDKLLSLEATFIWFNEARQIRKAIIDAATGRVGRYPSKKEKPDSIPNNEWPTRFGIIADTNPPTDEHWWYDLAENESWRADVNTKEILPIESFSPSSRWEFFDQPSGVSSEAENIKNLPKNYYENLAIGKNKEWVDVYVHGKYGFIKDGKPVYEASWNDGVHTAKSNLKIIEFGQIIGGFDSSGRCPAVVFLQRTSRGQWQAVHELCVLDMGAEQFCQLLKSEIAIKFPTNEVSLYGDPAGTFKSQNDERTYVEIARAAGLKILPAPTTNRIGERIATVEHVLNKMVDGEPAFIVSPSCKVLRRGFNGGYKYRQLQVSGEERHADEPDKKSKFSHPHDALQYGLSGAGETRSMKRSNSKFTGNITARTDFNV